MNIYIKIDLVYFPTVYLVTTNTAVTNCEEACHNVTIVGSL